MDDPMHNVVWHALTGPHAVYAIGHGAARHYPRAMAPVSAIEQPNEQAYRDLEVDLPAGLEARLFRPDSEPTPKGWETISAQPILCMLLARPLAAPEGHDIRPLGEQDVPDMLALADAAKPGPFGPRTVAFGGYVGIRDRATGALLAMGGTRLRLPGFIEISAIAVHPSARGHGLGAALTAALAAAVQAAGAVPFLHVFPANPARSLYQRLGFAVHVTTWVIWRRPLA